MKVSVEVGLEGGPGYSPWTLNPLMRSMVDPTGDKVVISY